MPQPFRLLTVEEFAALLDQYPFSRRINAVHMHHTWRPNHAQDRGHDSVVSMWRFHTETMGWSDIAQHVTIDSQGRIWTGRDWNSPPASAAGHNGNQSAGPFMFEMIGDFDAGKDPFEGAQRETTLRVIAHVQRRFGLPPEALRFHNEMSPKSCPGTGIDRAEVVAAVRRLHEDLAEKPPAATSQPIEAIEPFGPEMLVTHDVLNDLVGLQHALAMPRGGADGDAELPEQRMSREQVYLLFGGDGPTDDAARGGTAGRGRLTSEMLAELRPHLVNLTEGRFSGGGRYQTDRGDVDALFGEHLPEALKRARKLGEPLHLVFYAHGGLVSEGAALEMAYTHVNWWKQHPNVYPVYFVWETGLFETLGQLLDGRSRDIQQARAAATDWLVERMLRIGHVGPRVWSAMKQSAALASAEGGGARYVADGLAGFARRYNKAFGDGEVRLHGVGHSAGSIFHAHFIPAALDVGVPAFETLHFLAPAIRVDEFLQRLAPRLGDGIDHLAMFTMRKELERADTCKGVYRKSLLYLIYHALEREREVPILGLEENLRADAATADLFGLAGAQSDVAEVVFSKTDTISGQRATTATTHGGFDNDAPTMQSVLRRVLDAEPGELVAPFPVEAQRGIDAWAPSEPLPQELTAFAQGFPQGGVAAAPVRPPTPIPPQSTPSPVMPATAQRGQRRALCIGIDDYPTQPLAGCVHDAQTWAALLRDLGFETELLLNGTATRAGILDRLRALVGSGEPSDVLVFQYAGHGTYFDDESRDEDDARDEAFCPVDLHTGAVVLDDEVREVFAQLRDGVNLTCFIDCCHSGSITRLAPKPGLDERPRTMAPTPAMRAFHQRLKAERGRSRTAATPAAMRDVTFAACQPYEVAWESNGQGEFTVRGTAVLRERGLGLSNQAFYDVVLDRFGPSPRQTPYFDAADAAKARSLLAPLVGPSGDSGGGGGVQPSRGPESPRALVQGLHRAVQQFEQALANL